MAKRRNMQMELDFPTVAKESVGRHADMITMESARDHAKGEPEFFKAYRQLGGKLTEDQYQEVSTIFFYETIDAYVFGQDDRRVAWARFCTWLGENYPAEDAGMIFHSIDSVHAYT